MNGNFIDVSNGLRVSIDWLSFTVTSQMTIDDVVGLLGYTRMDFDNMDRGGKGYKSMIKLNSYPVYILFDGKEDMGIHVDISGTAVSEIVQSFKKTLKTDTPFGIGYSIGDFNSTFLCELLNQVRSIGHITRIDLAVDDLGVNYFTTDDIITLLSENRIVSKFRTYRNLVESEMCGKKTGHTVYLGSRKSEMFLRVYDKGLEQNKKFTDLPPLNFSWVRWELESKGERANKIVDLMLNNQNLGEICIGVLGNYIRIINLDNENRSRCSIAKKWIDFLSGIQSLKLYVPTVLKSIDDKKDWIKKQVMPTLSAIVISDGGSLEFIENNLQSACSRMKKPLLELIELNNPDYFM